MMKLHASLLLVLFPLATACARDSAPSDEERPDAPSPPVETRPVDRSDDPNVIVFESMGTATDIPFVIPHEAIGFNVVVEDPSRESLVDAIGIERIVAPDGTVVHDRFMPRGGNHATSISSVGRMATAGVPMGEAVPKWLGGTWTMRVAVPNDATRVMPVRATIHIQGTGSVVRGGVLDLHVHVPRGLEAAGDGGDGIARRLDRFFDTWDQLFGIGRGRVTMFEEDASLASVDDIEKGTALASTRGATDPKALQVLITRKITAKRGDVKGYTPAIPGAAGMFGTALSGIIVVLTESLDDDVNTLVHEAGHFFGLNHTTELDGEATDPLSDTPTCIMGGGSFDRCADKSNLMFAVGALAKPIVVSEMQKRVVRGSPIYRAF